MSLLPNDFEQRTEPEKEKKKIINNEVEKEDSWMPDTPTKPKPTKKSAFRANGVEFDSPSSSNKRKNRGEINHQLPKGTRKKIYRPKLISQVPKRTKKSQAKGNTPRPSTPKQKRSYVRKRPLCKRHLFDGNPLTVSNELGIEYNSLQNYQEVSSSLSSSYCVCLAEDKRIGLNFPSLFKKRRVSRQRTRLEKLLTSSTKGKRSKNFTRKKKHWIDFSVEGCSFMNKRLISRIKKIHSLKKKRSKKAKKLVGFKGSKELVLYKKLLTNVNVLLDEETSRVWNLLKDEKGHAENDEWKKKYWEYIRTEFQRKVELFIGCMHLIQGDRRFIPWKGSVLDSVVGVLLTQNVADYLSSWAYMTLASKFPVEKQEPNRDIVIFPSLKYEKEMEENKHEEMEAQNAKNSSKVDDDKGTTNNSSVSAENVDPPGMLFSEKTPIVKKKNAKKEQNEKLMEEKRQYWDTLRKLHTKDPRHSDHMDSIDWEAVRCAKPSEVAKAIESRGQHNVIADRIQELLNRLMNSNGNLDLEWLRYAPPKEVKEYLLTIHGLGLKSVECIRLLALQQSAFPVDINVARIVVRLGWVPLQPLPESIQIHNLDKYPHPDKIQEYLWPRLCTLDPCTLYELHYQLITFGKVFCTQNRPNCDACPFKTKCKYYASDRASGAKFALPESTSNEPTTVAEKLALPESAFISEMKNCEPIIEMPASPEYEATKLDEFEVNIDEEFYKDDCNDIPDIEDIVTVKLSNEESHNYNYSQEDYEHEIKSTALVVLHENATNIPMPMEKNASRLKTEHYVYVLPDEHPLLVECTPRDPDDQSPYLLLKWGKGEFENSCELTKNNLQDEDNSLTVLGTLLIPCRTAMRARFPLNGTYFQTNEVFVDYASMIHPINVPTKWIWNLRRQIVYLGTSVTQMTKGCSLSQAQDFFWKGFNCVRAFDTKTRAPMPLSSKLHRSTTAKD